MLEFKSYASSSDGNLYAVASNGTALLLEAGLSLASVRRSLGFKLSQFDGCLLTHEHQDHAKGAADMLRAGVDIYCTAGTACGAGLSGHRLHVVEPLKQFKVGPWKILPFPTIHNAEQPAGFLLANGQDKLLFAVDTATLAYQFRGLTHIAIECNWESSRLRDSVFQGHMERFVARKIRRAHMSLERLEMFLRAQDLGRVQEIHLLHLSDNNVSEDRARRKVEGIAGVPAYVADK